MRFSIIQRFEVGIVLLLIKLLYLLDVLTGAIFEKILTVSTKALVLLVSITFVGGLVYSYKTGFVEHVTLGLVADTLIQDNKNTNVLGVKTVKKDFPILARTIELPITTAKAILIYDKNTAKVLYEKNANLRLASASTTKLMTALVALDIYALDEVLSISPVCFEEESTKADLPLDGKFRVESLLNAMLISSAGDAACALARGKIGYDEFVYLMNQKAYRLGMSSSYFTNPIGLDGTNSSHFSSANDLLKLAAAAMQEPAIRQIVSKKDYTIKSAEESYIGILESTNQLLFEIPQTIGIKTGTTAEAGQVFIYEFKDETKDLVLIVMGSEDRFTDTRGLLNWALVSYDWE